MASLTDLWLQLPGTVRAHLLADPPRELTEDALARLIGDAPGRPNAADFERFATERAAEDREARANAVTAPYVAQAKVPLQPGAAPSGPIPASVRTEYARLTAEARELRARLK